MWSLYISSDHFPIVHEAGAVRGIFMVGLSKGTGLRSMHERGNTVQTATPPQEENVVELGEDVP